MAVLAVFFKRLRLLDFSRTCLDLAVSTGTTVGTLGSKRGLVPVGSSAEPSTIGAVIVVRIGGSTPFRIARGAESSAIDAESLATGAEDLATGAEGLATGAKSLAVLGVTPSGAKPGASILL